MQTERIKTAVPEQEETAFRKEEYRYMKTERITVKDRLHPRDEELMEAAEILRKGGLVAFPTETVYGLGANALDEEAARRIYAAKGRPSDNPLIAHIADEEGLKPLVAYIPETARKLMDAFWPGPLTMIFPKSDLVPYGTTGGLDTVAVRMPSDPVARRLIALAGVPVAAPSANTSGRPSPTTADHVWEDMNGRIEMIVDSGPVGIGVESTIVDVTGEVPMMLRPGAITMEMLRELLGEVETDPAIVGPMSPDAHPKAPGMKYRHYAPKADMTLVEGETEAMVARICCLAKESMKEGKNVGIICTEETRNLYPKELLGAAKVMSMGMRSKEESIAHNLYAVLREFDRLETDCIFCEAFPATELGQAIMNRLTKAAGHKIIKV